jgi:hypothetical protein
LYRTGLPTGGKQWSWHEAGPLVRSTLWLPEVDVEQAKEAGRWRGIGHSSVLRLALRLGLPLALQAIDLEDRDQATANNAEPAE